jgi:hypothetical protein
MSGYIPVFDTVFEGTLCGQWPTLPVWLSILPLADKNGLIDMTYQAISVLSGWPIELLKEGIAELMKPDPESRSNTAGGRRLELIDPDHRSWGWRVVNHSYYREKARKHMHDIARVVSGENAARLRAKREAATRDDPTSAAPTPADPLSNADADANKNPTARRMPTRHASPAEFLDFKAAYPRRAGDPGWRKALRAANARLPEGHTWAEMIAGACHYAAFVRSSGKEGTEYVKQAASFLGPDKAFLETWNIPPPSSRAANGAADPAALVAWETLIANRGPRDARSQRALGHVGGWGRIQLRTPFEEPQLKREFCSAWSADSGNAEKGFIRGGIAYELVGVTE